MSFGRYLNSELVLRTYMLNHAFWMLVYTCSPYFRNRTTLFSFQNELLIRNENKKNQFCVNILYAKKLLTQIYLTDTLYHTGLFYLNDKITFDYDHRKIHHISLPFDFCLLRMMMISFPAEVLEIFVRLSH